MDATDIVVFVKVVQTGSFGKAARNLQISKSTVSAKVAQLEERLSVPLLYRSTHALRVTQAGDAFFRKCIQALEIIDTAESEVKANQESQRGNVKVTAPKIIGYTVLPHVLGEFSKKYPNIKVETILTDRTLDLISEGVDIAIRVTKLADSTLICRKAGESILGLFAAPGYLKTYGVIERPSDLSNHSCLMFSDFGEEYWELHKGKEKREIRISGQHVSDDLEFLKIMALRGKGVALLPTYSCTEEIKAKALIQVLPSWSSPDLPIYLVYPPHRFMSKKVESLIEFLKTEMSKFPV